MLYTDKGKKPAEKIFRGLFPVNSSKIMNPNYKSGIIYTIDKAMRIRDSWDARRPEY